MAGKKHLEQQIEIFPTKTVQKYFTEKPCLRRRMNKVGGADLTAVIQEPVHPLFQRADELSRAAIGAAIEVHRLKGPGLLEGIYEKCLLRALELQKVAAVNQRAIHIDYKGITFEEVLRFDVLIENCLLLELKCVQQTLPIHKAQLLSYMNLLDVPLGLLVNFHEIKLVDGVIRMMLPKANLP